MRIRFLLGNIALLLVILSPVSANAEDSGPLRLEKEIPLPSVEGRIDHLSADEAGERLFVAALGNGSVEIVDLRKGERTAQIKGLEEPQRASTMIRKLAGLCCHGGRRQASELRWEMASCAGDAGAW
jgi:hypothetical protein